MQNLNVFMCQGRILRETRSFREMFYLKPEESPKDRWFWIVNNVMSLYDLYEIHSGFSFLVSKFSPLSILTERWRWNIWSTLNLRIRCRLWIIGVHLLQHIKVNWRALGERKLIWTISCHLALHTGTLTEVVSFAIGLFLLLCYRNQLFKSCLLPNHGQQTLH